MSKFGKFDEYPQPSLNSAEAALLTAWPSLERYHDDLVLVGGLAIYYLTKRNFLGLPGAVTMDVDFGVSLGASGGQYGTIKSDLAGLGFKPEKDRLVRQFGNLNLYLDFLTEDPPSLTGTRTVDDVMATIIPGINRALEGHRMVQIKGTDFYGSEKTCPVRVADIGPLLVLKLNAFGGPTGRRHPKDAYDILLAVTAFIDGPQAAVTAFREEARKKNSGYSFALDVLRKDFSSIDQDGPIRAAEFVRELVRDQQQVREDVLSIGEYLLRG